VKKKDDPPLPPATTGIFLGLWAALFLVLAVFVVPQIFASCAPPSP
jgi:hypothetical protein